MKKSELPRVPVLVLATCLAASWPCHAADTVPRNDKDKDEEEVLVLTPFLIEAGPSVGYSAACTIGGSRLGATVGGAKDARYFRDTVADGGFPHPSTITAEGLFSEHDLPVRLVNPAKSLLVLNAEAVPARLMTVPEVRYLAQVGLSSGLEAATWHREPLNLVAVVDKSGSMSGQPLSLVKRCLQQVLRQLGPEDRISIVLYGDRSHVHLEPTPTTEANREMIAQAIDGIQSAGSTNMEAGLRVGFDLARRSKEGFRGVTRVMQFTDERPNTGDTSKAGFMGLMEAGARDGIGQTTVGVGVQFDAEMASRISTVHGGNLFYFGSPAEMEKTFAEELDTMVSELAYDLELKVHPARGLRVAAVYGIPGEMLQWSRDGRDVSFRVNTIFLSKRKGGIYLAFAPVKFPGRGRSPATGQSLAAIELSYREIGQDQPRTSQLDVPVGSEREPSDGLRRGRLLVSEYLGLRSAMTSHLSGNDQAAAYATLSELNTLLQGDADPALEPERQLVGKLTQSLARLSGHGSEPEPLAWNPPEDEGYRARTVSLQQ